MGWWIAGGVFVLWIAYQCWRYYDNQGRHNTNWYDDFIPKGSVWMRQGVWYTQPRFDYPVPRRFDERSNPLDIEPEVELVTVPPQQRRVEREVEY
ncbi:hypothetical protein JRC04_04605 [Mycolicibacterium sp. S2-37]|uniref:hypothetical protein n=1 Tax=Mycolicibacterium sp. S2-37 TaxID=2810297 RepID=UPI001A946163|nr:hypothetical protein [Mycolicibacterium sp. S2-37]MBO0676739.1 hypothetical protein [Mycolicibacterium sp. S2-37]